MAGRRRRAARLKKKARLQRCEPALIPAPARSEPLQPWPGAAAAAQNEPHAGLSGRLAAVGVRGLVRFAHWRGRREAARDLKRAGLPPIRGFIQINLIRPH